MRGTKQEQRRGLSTDWHRQAAPTVFLSCFLVFLGTVAFYSEATISTVQIAGDERRTARVAPPGRAQLIPYLEYPSKYQLASAPPLQQDRNGPQPCPRRESNLQNQQPEKTMTKLRCSRALWGRGAHREGGTSASINAEKTYESHSRIGAPSGTPHRAPRPSPPPLPRENKKEGTVQHTSRESNPEPSPPKLLETLVQNKNAPHHYSQNNMVKKQPHVLGRYSFLDMYTVWGTLSPSGMYTVWGQKS